MKRLIFYVGGILVSLILATMIFPGCKKKQKVGTYYSPNNNQTNFTVSLDSIGLVKRLQTNLDSIKSRLSQQGYEYVRNISLQLLVFVPKKKKIYTQSELVKLIKSLVNVNKDFLLSGGMVTYEDSIIIPKLVNDEIIVEFKPGINKISQDSYFNQYSLTVLRQNPYVLQQYVVIPKGGVFTDIFQKVRDITDTSLVAAAAPNFIIPVFPLTYRPDDPLYDLQWHIVNNGDAGGTPDADCDADLAWEFFTKGRSDVTIAVIDFGFEIDHPDLYPNWKINVEEQEGSTGQNDNQLPNTQVDDIIGWNFQECVEGNPLTCGGPTMSLSDHGTAAAGVAAARGNNTEGVSGICPECSMIPIEIGFNADAISRCFRYAIERKVRVITMSVGFSPDEIFLKPAIQAAYDAGIIILVAGDNSRFDRCQVGNGLPADLGSLVWTVGIARSNNLDKYDNSGFGNCIDLMGPTYYKDNPDGTLGIVTTDLTGGSGTHTELMDNCPVAVPIENLSYTSCFQGTSAATPLVAGIAGLIISVNPSITREQVKNLLQDCADRVDHIKGHYSPINGFSNYGTVDPATHGFGRVNGYEAVKIAYPNIAGGGRNGIDIFLRDNELDWGNTEKPSNYGFESPRTFVGHWRSPDIKIDAPPFGPAPTNNAQFEAFTDEKPIGLKDNKVYVRVRNRGFNPALNVDVKLYWVYGGLALPQLWNGFPQDAASDPIWTFLGTKPITNLQYSGSSIAGTGGDQCQIVGFNFPAPDPAANSVNHYCLLAMLDSPEDPLPSTLSSMRALDEVTPNFNNVTHRNIRIDPAIVERGEQALYAYNSLGQTAYSKIIIDNPSKIPIKIGGITPDSVFILRSGEKRLIRFHLGQPKSQGPVEVTLIQKLWANRKDTTTGGFTFYFGKKR